ncbi:hypothetical protein ACI2KT_25455 [Ensifer adhaerens]|uniref:hypothetical protein n=1 Tax=Ensifer TaxID=106591 RepID=UPI0017838E38|nr:hypothetical protein [Ensifer sp. ENS08]MBD9573020.1 hypothetical protein [Ensifer sp. ENS08]
MGDGSEPRAENDRFVLDQLWGRSSKVTQRYADWVEGDLKTSEAEKDAAFVRLFLIADFWGDHGPRKAISLRRVREIVADASGDYSIPFDNVYQTSGGFVCRQTAGNNPELMGLTWKLGSNFHSEIIVPLAKFRQNSLSDLAPWLDGYEHTHRFLRLCHKQRYFSPTIIDLNILLHVLLGIARIQVALAKEFSWNGPVYLKMEISGIWRTIPFFDTSKVLDEYEKHGMALGLGEKVAIHSGREQSSFIEITRPDDNDDEGQRVLVALRLFIPIAIALGIPVPEDEHSDWGDYIGDFLRAGLRALEVQKNRSRLKA